jgi:hypothetical protein
MIADSVELQEVCRAFHASLGDLDRSIAVSAVADVEADIGRRVGVLARALGWRNALEYRLRPLDLPRAGPFPQRLHQHAGRMRLNGGGAAELSMNVNALDVGNFSIFVGRLPSLLWTFGAVLERAPEIVADVPIFPGDASFWDAVTFSGSHPEVCLIPDPDYFRTAGYAGFRDAMEDGRTPWESRRGEVVWRGSATGIKRYWPPTAPDDVRWLPRLELCARARSESIAGLCDIGFIQLVQLTETDRAMMEKGLAPLRRAPMEKELTAGFKATIDIDGNSNTWSSGLYCSFLTGACVIKVGSEHDFRQWYYDRIEPWVHYAPVRADLSDFETVLRTVLSDDGLARRIGESGRALATSMDFWDEMSDAADRVIAYARRHRLPGDVAAV